MSRCEICGGFVGSPDHDENGDCSIKPYPNYPCSAEPIEKPKDVCLMKACRSFSMAVAFLVRGRVDD